MENTEQKLDDNADPDGFVIAPDDPRANAHRLLSQLAREIQSAKRQMPLTDLTTGKTALKMVSQEAVDLIIAIPERVDWLFEIWVSNRQNPADTSVLDNYLYRQYQHLTTLLFALGKASSERKQTFRTKEVTRLLETAVQQEDQSSGRPDYRYWKSHSSIVVRLVMEHIAAQGILIAWRPLLERLRDVPRAGGHADALCMAQIFGYGSLDIMPPGSLWVNRALQDVARMEHEERGRWIALLRCAARRESARKPSGRLLRDAKTHIEAVGKDKFQEHLNRWLALVGKPVGKWQPDVVERRYLYGLIGLAAILDNADSAGQIGWVAVACAENAQCLHACFDALAAMPGLEPLFELTRLQTKITNKLSLKMLNKALTAASKRAGFSRFDMDDLTVPTFGLEMPGQMQQMFGAYAVTIHFGDAIKGVWQWVGSNGKARKTLPSEVKLNHAPALDALKARAHEIEEMREFQCARIENFYRDRHDWSLENWRARYASHPLLASFARSLIWQLQEHSLEHSLGNSEETASFSPPDLIENADPETAASDANNSAKQEDLNSCVLGIWREDRFEGVDGKPIEGLTETMRVRLWHPVGTAVETVLAWRARLETLGIMQPFKQAYREAYLLTDAERSTNLYSNRFAAHIIKQFPFHRLCNKMGWQNHIRIVNGSSDKRAVYPLPEWNLQAEFWIEPVDDPSRQLHSNMSYNYLSTDQVRFSDTRRANRVDGRNRPVALNAVSPQLFWEIMRDVDRLVTHCSVIADPNWQDRGADLTLVADNSITSFGGNALGLEARRETLAKLLPRLRIASRCDLGDKFLTVRGDVRTYKINLATSHISMDPNDQYLCIIKSRTPPGEAQVNPAALPFEGDTTLALIMSKAFLLAADATITDPVILQQIHPRQW